VIRPYAAFLSLTSLWLGAAVAVYGNASANTLTSAIVWWALLFAILDATAAFHVIDVRIVGWIGFGAAAAHPIVVDWPHRKRHRNGLAGSPVPAYVPDACLAIDWTLAALVLAALLVL
jgi:hypothetical protein